MIYLAMAVVFVGIGFIAGVLFEAFETFQDNERDDL